MGWKKGLRIQLLCRQDRQFHGLWTCQSVWMDYDLTLQWKNYPFSCMIIPFFSPWVFLDFPWPKIRILSQLSDWGVLREQLSQCLNEDAAAAYEARLSQERKHVGCQGFIWIYCKFALQFRKNLAVSANDLSPPFHNLPWVLRRNWFPSWTAVNFSNFRLSESPGIIQLPSGDLT